jgi:hypothetical protein
LQVLGSKPGSIADICRQTSTVGTFACIGAAALVVGLDAREVRLQSPADYDCLANARALLAGGHWIPDPAASVAALISRLAAVDPMEALGFLRALALPGSVMAWMTDTCSLNIACAWSALFLAFLLGAVAGGGVHRRDRWHVVPACMVAICAVMAPSAAGHADSGYVEYDAAARQTLAIARAFDRGDSVVAALPEQRVELPDPRTFLPLSTFVNRFGDRAGQRQFRFNMPGHHLFVFVEKMPLQVKPGTALVPVSYTRTVSPGRLPNARARLERRALELCEQYRRTHADASIYYEDPQLRVYHFRH